ncbi:hypothetical protein [Clostridium tetani]|uniref:hypothetical protein n=1 Tax=Clostridium tetani TaxID=1513 RepID=UPI00051438BA|nr:hypothetical protein [Clostridium tetani]KGI44828.1 hypothetical protein KY55_02330 [Clostridium tetani]RXI70675.1 hypothetical protein DP127_08525 [Clostridium tetani]RXM59321.1 hypothetical protein DP133_00330 [Clostridium tetani]BDR76157.1 hypothetical protein K154306013_18170 [Clostridium tetani]BDR87275.1 hypothetical protein N071400001_18830 [Clostridium tetani]
MRDFNKLMQLLIEYLQKSTQPISTLDWIIKYGIPIIQVIVVVGGAIAAVYKYYSVKNREINEKMLNEVYAPLYQYFVKQEMFCYIHKVERDYKESPILEITSKKTEEKISVGKNQGYSTNTTYESVLDLNRNEFLKVLDSVNIGLASKELLTLLNMYKVIMHIEGTADKTSNSFLDATIMKVDVENSLREEIIKGYKEYHRKLNLKTITPNKYFVIKDDNIEFIYNVDVNKKEKLVNQINNNPENF